MEKRDKVIFSLEDGTVVLKRPKFASIADVAGSVSPLPGDIDEMIREAKEEKAQREIEKMGGGARRSGMRWRRWAGEEAGPTFSPC